MNYLSKAKQRMILAQMEQEHMFEFIAKVLKHPIRTIWKYWLDPEHHNQNNYKGRKKITIKQTNQLILNLASSGKMFCRVIKN